MADINHVVLLGRLTRDAELRYTSSGIPVCNFAIAVNRRRKVGDNWEEEASFFDVVLWGRQGEALNQYLVKGKQVGIDGELRQNRWEQDGAPRSRVEIVASNVQLLGGNSGGGQNSGGYQQYNSAPTQQNQQSRYQQGGQSAYQQRNTPPADNYDAGYNDEDLETIPF